MKGKYFHKETVRGICIKVYQEICPVISLATQDLEFHTPKQLPLSIAVWKGKQNEVNQDKYNPNPVNWERLQWCKSLNSYFFTENISSD